MPGGLRADRFEATGGFTHVDAAGRARMVDVTAKARTLRRALARGRVELGPAERAALGQATGARSGEEGLGDVFAVAAAAGVAAAKSTARLVPLCHPLPTSRIEVRLSLDERGVAIEAETEVFAQTGIEMEALTACAVAGLALVAAIGPSAEVTLEDVCLLEKSGGRSGTWTRPGGDRAADSLEAAVDLEPPLT